MQSGGLSGGLRASSDLCWCLVSVALDDPQLVVLIPELQEGNPELFDGVEVPHPEQVLLECADEPLRTSVAFGGTHEAGGSLDAQEGDLVLEVVGDVLRTVVVP